MGLRETIAALVDAIRVGAKARSRSMVGVLVGLGVLEIAHAALAHAASGLSPFVSTTIASWGEVRIALRAAQSAGPAWGPAFERQPTFLLSGALYEFAIAVALFRLVPPAYVWQRRVLLGSSLGALANVTERALTGSVRDYFEITLGPSQWPTFNIRSVVVLLGACFFGALVIARFFGRQRRPPGEARGELHDPLYEHRTLLRAAVALVTFALALGLAAPEITPIRQVFSETPLYVDRSGKLHEEFELSSHLIESFVGRGPPEVWYEVRGRARLLCQLAALALLCLRLVPAAAVCWFGLRWIPSRPVEVIFLRAFARDRESMRLLRRLRRRLGRSVRVTGVTRPGERYRWRDLLLLWVFPFAALGDMGQVMAGGHSVFLDENWMDGIRRAFGQARATVFDVRTMTDALAWEISRSLEILGSARTYFVGADVTTINQTLSTLKRLDVVALDLDQSRMYREDNVGSLATTLRGIHEQGSPRVS
jgi:lipoprotein signal peptidase